MSKKNDYEEESVRKFRKYGEVIGPQPKPVWLFLSTVALLMIVAGTIIPLFNARGGIAYAQISPLFKYIYAVGAALLLISRLFSPYKGKVLRIKRLYRIEFWSSVFFCVAAFFVFYEPYSTRNWLAFTLAGGVIQIITSIRIPIEVKKALRRE